MGAGGNGAILMTGVIVNKISSLALTANLGRVITRDAILYSAVVKTNP